MEGTVVAPVRTKRINERVIAYYFGRNEGDVGWSLRGLNDERGLADPELKQRFDYMCEVAQQCGIRTILAPNFSETNNKVIWGEEFLEYGNAITGSNGVTVYRGYNVEVVTVPRGFATAVMSADCYTLLLWTPHMSHIVVAHCGRNSLIDPEKIAHNTKSRHSDTVVRMALAALNSKRVVRDGDICAHIMCGIGAPHFSHPLDHPQYGAKNRRLHSFVRSEFQARFGIPCFVGDPNEGNLHIPNLIRCQLLNITHRQINLGQVTDDCLEVDTYGDYTTRKGHAMPVWYSQRRPADDKKRNLLLIANK